MFVVIVVDVYDYLMSEEQMTTSAEMLLNGNKLDEAFWNAYKDHYYPLCPGCNRRISPGKQLPPAERNKYDGAGGKHLSVCPLSLTEV